MTFRFGEHISLDLPKPVSIENDDFDNTVAQITSKAMIKVAEQIDDAIFNEIVAIAHSEGIDDVYLLDKKNIISALEKQIPKKPNNKELVNGGFAWQWVCPNCCSVKITTEKPFCDDCGQALDWGDSNG